MLLDVQLPDMTGFDICEECGDLDETAIVLVSSRDAGDYDGLIESSGARGFIAKADLSGDAVPRCSLEPDHPRARPSRCSPSSATAAAFLASGDRRRRASGRSCSSSRSPPSRWRSCSGLRTAGSRPSVTDVVLALQGGIPIRDALADALDDPSLEIAYRLPGSAQWVDAAGHRVAEPQASDGRAVTLVEWTGLPDRGARPRRLARG